MSNPLKPTVNFHNNIVLWRKSMFQTPGSYQKIYGPSGPIGAASREIKKCSNPTTFMGGYLENGAWPWASSKAVIPKDHISALQKSPLCVLLE
jgi:hypothetical protein